MHYLNRWASRFAAPAPTATSRVALVSDAPRQGIGNVTVYLDAKDTNDGQATRYVQISARAIHANGRVAKARPMRVGQQNFSRYAYFSDLELRSNGTKIWFATGDNLYGPVHTNDQFHISGTPTFHQETSSVASTIDYQNGGPPTDNPDFKKGVTLGAAEIPLPSDLIDPAAKAQATDGLFITGIDDRRRSTSTTTRAGQARSSWSRKDGGAPTTYDLPANGVVYVDGIAEVRGQLAGQLTIASPRDLRIVDDVTYHTDPRIDPTSTRHPRPHLRGQRGHGGDVRQPRLGRRDRHGVDHGARRIVHGRELRLRIAARQA